MEEKEYVFFMQNSDKESKRITLRESELDQKHRNVLLGELIKTWNNCPNIVQLDFMYQMMKEFEYQNNEKFIEKFKNEAI